MLFTAYQAMLKTKCCKLISALRFHFLLVEKVCFDCCLVTQKYLSLLGSERSLALHLNLADGDGGQVHRRCG